MIFVRSIKFRHDEPSLGFWAITDRAEVGLLRVFYRMARRQGLSAFAARGLVTNCLRVGRYSAEWESA